MAGVFKASSAAALFAMALAGGLLPLKLREGDVGRSRVASIANMVAGGVFFSAAMVHMLPESSQRLREVYASHGDVPLGGLLCAVGFLLVLTLDRGAAVVQHARALSLSRVAGGDEGQALVGDGFVLPRGDDTPHAQYRGGKPHTHQAHSHAVPGSADGLVVRLALLLALCFHALMEGLGIGAAPKRAWGLLAAVAAHKSLAAYALGTALLEISSCDAPPSTLSPPAGGANNNSANGAGSGGSGSGSSSSGVRSFWRRHHGLSQPIPADFIGHMVLFSSMTPLGIGLGFVIGQSGSQEGGASAVCVALASGTFLYVALMEVIPHELQDLRHGAAKLVALILGFAAMTVIGFLTE